MRFLFNRRQKHRHSMSTCDARKAPSKADYMNPMLCVRVIARARVCVCVCVFYFQLLYHSDGIVNLPVCVFASIFSLGKILASRPETG